MKRRARWTAIAAGGVVIAAGFAIALVELMRLPRGSVWIVAATAALLLFLLRIIGRP